MTVERPNVNKTSMEARNAIRRASAHVLPVNPSERGMKPDEIRRALWQPILGVNSSLLHEQDRLTEEVNEALGVLYDALGWDALPDAFAGSASLSEALARFFDLYGATVQELSALRTEVVGEDTLTTEGETLTAAVNELDARVGNLGIVPADFRADNVALSLNRVFLRYRKNQNEITRLADRIGSLLSHTDALTNGCANLTSGVNANTLLCNRLKTRMEAAEALLGSDPLETSDADLVSAINALRRDADRAQAKLLSLSTRVDGIAKNYVLRTFEGLLAFLGGEPIPDGEAWIYADDLQTGDHLLLAENNVPDFWYERTADAENVERYEYNGEVYELSVSDRADGTLCGCLHPSETDYTVIEGYATSASASASLAVGAKAEALETLAETKRTAEASARQGEALADELRTLADSLSFHQVAPPFATLNDAEFLMPPTLAMLAAEQEGSWHIQEEVS